MAPLFVNLGFARIVGFGDLTILRFPRARSARLEGSRIVDVFDGLSEAVRPGAWVSSCILAYRIP